jgi:hypothetical protein
MTLVNGARYEGNFENDLFSGKGVYRWKDGRQVDGIFHQGKLNGYVI